jgi:hypothetical protein
VNYRRIILHIHRLAAIVSKHSPLSPSEADKHLQVPESYLGKIVGSVRLGEPISVSKHDQNVEEVTLSPPELHKTFKKLHPLDKMKPFSPPRERARGACMSCECRVCV